MRVHCKNSSCTRTPLRSVAAEKRGYCGARYPSQYSCADELPRKDKKAHKKQYPNAYDSLIDGEFVLIVAIGLFFITFKIVLSYVINTYFPESDYSWSELGGQFLLYLVT